MFIGCRIAVPEINLSFFTDTSFTFEDGASREIDI
jgi:hypothetical protein